jgi:hypothetical protein
MDGHLKCVDIDMESSKLELAVDLTVEISQCYTTL